MADEDYYDEDELGYFYVEDAYAIAVSSRARMRGCVDPLKLMQS
jgi:hypothetical protein